MGRNNKPWSYILWHPHEKLWNWKLVVAIQKIIPISPINQGIITVIILVDTFILFLRAWVRRLSLLGHTKIFTKMKIPNDISVLYLDLGTHKKGKELAWAINNVLPHMCNNFEAYGFEASQESFKQVSEEFTKTKNVSIFNVALCHVLPKDGKIKFYKDMKTGASDSIYRQSAHYEEVKAMRLSDWLSENNIVLENKIILLRMNIEGAEYDVIKDLVERGLTKYIDGYYGLWNDVCRIDKQRDDEFRAFLKKNQISSFTFNGRDLRWSLRKKCIEYDINTSIQKGLLRLGRINIINL
jgi:FkbM family methyltransferase